MKKGDRLYCYHGISSMGNSFTKGKFYVIKSIEKMKRDINYVIVYDDNNNLMPFSLMPFEISSVNHYSNYFYTEQELRKMKLEKLNSI